MNVTDEPGCFLQPDVKRVLLGDYRGALNDHKFINPSAQGMKECLQFVSRPGDLVEHSGAANSQDPSGAKTAHGDETIADALANKGVEEEAQVTPEERESDPPPGCLAYRRKKRERDSQTDSNSELDGKW